MYKKLLDKFDLSIGEIFSYKNNTYVVKDNGIYKWINAKKMYYGYRINGRYVSR